MHRIALSKIKSIEKCAQCNSQLQVCSTLSYCAKCKKTQNIIDDTIRQVNFNFKLHYQQNKSKQATFSKIQLHAKDIFCQINMKPNQSQINQIVQKVKFLHKRRGVNKKGYKQQTAAIIYSEFQVQIRMNLTQFCQINKIPRKKFNKMYLQYKNLMKQVKYSQNVSIKKQEESEQQKEMVKYQQDSNKQESQNEQIFQQEDQSWSPQRQQQNIPRLELLSQLKRPSSLINVQSDQFKPETEKQLLKKTIQSIYDNIFPTVYLLKHKQEIINSIVKKALTVSESYMQSKPLNKLKPYFRGPAIIYSIIKINGFKIKLKDYLAIVEKKLEVKITSRMISTFTILCKSLFPKIDEQQYQGSATQFLGSSQTSSQNSQNLG